MPGKTKARWYASNHRYLKKKFHSQCFFNTVHSLDLNFTDTGEVSTDIFMDKNTESYQEIVHGGILSALLDSVMTQCIFGHGYAAYTANMHIKYLEPVKSGNSVQIRAKIDKTLMDKVILIHAEVLQEDRKKVTCEGRFWIFYNNEVEAVMKKIAVPVRDGSLSSHFGHSPNFAIFEVGESGIKSEVVKTPPPHEPGAIPKWVNGLEVNVIITGGIGTKAKKIFDGLGIEVLSGAEIKVARELVEDYLENRLKLDNNHCHHH